MKKLELKNTNPLFNETFVFRPIFLDWDKQGLYRYNNGDWIPDDGQYDLAFALGTEAYYINIPQYSNLLWHWFDNGLTKKWLPEYLHRNAKSWHEMTVNGTPLDENYRRFKFSHDDSHPNSVVGRLAMDYCCKLHSCASGQVIYITDGQYTIGDGKYWKPNEYLQKGLVKIQRTLQPIPPPDKAKLECYLCKDNGKGHLIQALQGYKDDIECKISDCQEHIDKAQSDIYYYEDEMGKANEELPEVVKELKDLGVEINKDEE